MIAFRSLAAAALAAAFAVACADDAADVDRSARPAEVCADHDPLRRPYFGDLHIHTTYSLDASTQGTLVGPADSYRFARGERLAIQPYDASGRALRHLQLARPLDFAAVTDHAEFFGEVTICQTPSHPSYNAPECILYREQPDQAFLFINALLSVPGTGAPPLVPKRVPRFPGICGVDGAECVARSRTPWRIAQDAAAEAYDRCSFTTFVGYEWSGSPLIKNLHRNVIFANEAVPEVPASYLDYPDPELLWAALGRDCVDATNGCDVLTIPHNSNLSGGIMFQTRDGNGQRFTRSFATVKQAFEPLVEIFQHKGDSECFFGPGAIDELCSFEKFRFNNLVADRFDGLLTGPPTEVDYVRHALRAGLAEQHRVGVNPFRYGIIASTDTHIGAPGAVAETRFPGHGGAGETTRGRLPRGLPDSVAFNPGGLAVLYAGENSRESLFAAMKRREAYGTSGPRIALRFFGGWSYADDLCADSGFVAAGYAGGVPMGGELAGRPAGAGAPAFAVWAMQDPGHGGISPENPDDPGDLGAPPEPGAPLERIQIVKGWLDADGETHEIVYDVAGGERGASVDLSTCEPEGEGDAELCDVWRDPDFDPAEPAFYYARAVENPTCRWTTRMCVAAGVDCSDRATITAGFADCCDPDYPPTIQERAWSSPIWYRP